MTLVIGTCLKAVPAAGTPTAKNDTPALPGVSTVMMQLNPPIPVDTPKGAAFAHLTIDYSQEHYVLFVCFLAESGECWVFPNRDVRLQKNLTMGVRVAPPCACREKELSIT